MVRNKPRADCSIITLEMQMVIATKIPGIVVQINLILLRINVDTFVNCVVFNTTQLATNSQLVIYGYENI